MDYVFNSLYLEEILILLPKIKARKNAEYKVITAIVQSPHTKDPSRIFTILNDNNDDNDKVSTGTGVELLKLALSKNPRFVVK